MNVGGHGIVAELQRSGKGPTIALGADMDVLPIDEETDLPFASSNKGVMHAYGHDAHTAILIGAISLHDDEHEVSYYASLVQQVITFFKQKEPLIEYGEMLEVICFLELAETIYTN